MGVAHAPRGAGERVAQRQAVCQVRQHADERHHIPAGRVPGEPQADPRGPRADHGRGRLGEDPVRPAAESHAAADGRRAPVPVVPDAGPGDRRHVPLPDRRHQGAVPEARAGGTAGVHAELQSAAAVRAQVQ